MATATEKLAKYAREMTFDKIPAKTVKIAKMQLMNMIATIFAGAKTKPGKIIFDAFKDAGGHPSATIIGSGVKVALDKAVLINGTYAQALDYEDYGMPMHNGCTVVPVSLGYCEVLKLSGKDLLLGMILGNEINSRIGMSLFPSVTTGQTMDPLVHPISTAVIGARLQGFEMEQIVNAIGIAAYLPQYPILKGFFGPHSKVLTSSLPALNGIIACQLAAKGFTGSHQIFTAPDGFCNLMADLPSPDRITIGLDHDLWMTDTLSFKLYPGCAYLDAPLDCVFQILEKNPTLDPDKIEKVSVKLPGLGTISMNLSDRPESTIEGLQKPDSSYVILNFNVPYNIAAALIDKELTPRQFTDDRILDPKIHELAKKVHVETDIAMTVQIFQSFLPEGKTLTSIDPKNLTSILVEALKGDFKWEFGSKVIIKTTDGTKFRASTKIARASAGNHDIKFIEDKFKREAADFGFDEQKISECLKILNEIEAHDSLDPLISIIG
ncbi:MAG: MmgE/PrpD family protein [Candidatus Helarchaeota archaeon]